MNTISVSIITITFNDLNGLVKTINSIDNNYDANNYYIDHVIIDGNSTDGTKEFVLSVIKSRAIETKLISETDLGIYDAMNKGFLTSSSKYVIFINSGDILLPSFFSLDLVNRLYLLYNKPNYAGLALSCSYTFNEKKIKVKSRGINLIIPRMPSLHQAIIYKRNVLVEIPYSLEYKICGDFENICRIIKLYKFETVDILISELTAGGVSTLKPFSLAKESFSVFKKHFNPNIFLKFFYLMKISISLIAVQCIYFIYNKNQAKF